jgi:hypothetical protein
MRTRPGGPALITLLAVAALLAGPATAAAKEPPITVPAEKLRAAFLCHGEVENATRQPIMLVTGTGATGEQAYAIGKGFFDYFGHPVCDMDFPHFMTADIQVSVQYLVYGIRREARLAGRRIAIVGISQGGLLPRWALTYWPSLRSKVTDVVAAAGTQHGTTRLRGPNGRRCSAQNPCAPANWQQAAGSHLLQAINSQPDESPGATSWTTVRSATDETVQPQTGRHPTSALDGAVNILIQGVCPGRKTTHIGTAVDSVTIAALIDAMGHPGGARVSRLPADVCSHPYGPGLDEAGTTAFLNASGGLVSSQIDSAPTVRAEPRVRAYATR